MSPRSIVSFVVGLCAIAAIPGVAFAADRYVTPTGLAGNSGTLASPWSLTKAVSSTGASPGDIVYIGGGTYTSRISIGVSGTASAPIVFRAVEGEVPILDQNGVTQPTGEAAVITISNRNYVTVQGLTVRNCRTDLESTTPIGISVRGTCQGVQLRDNIIHNIEQNNPDLGNFSANGHGMIIRGSSATALDGIIIDGNELYNLHLGASEAMAINGNVTNFRVTRNLVHHCNNIGIDLIGYEGSLPTNLDRARSGLVAENTVYAIDSSYNPAYDGDLNTGGGNRSAAGIYVDGGTDIIIERNQIYDSNFGIELASEDGAGFTDYITVRNNLIRHNQGTGLTMGGYNVNKGSTEHCTITGNTFYQNDTTGTAGGQISFQFYVNNNTFKNNLLWAQRGSRQMVMQTTGNNASGGIGTGNIFAYNLYFYEGAGGSPTPQFRLNKSGANTTYNSLATWQASSGMGDAGATFANPAFVVPVPSPASPVMAYQPTSASPAINTGDPTFTPGASEKEFFQKSRILAGRVDRGFSED